VGDIAKIAPEKIFIVHIDDARKIPFEDLGNFDRVLPGDGVIDCVRFVKTFFDNGYDGVVSVEILNNDLWKIPPEQLIPEAYEKARKIVLTAKGKNGL